MLVGDPEQLQPIGPGAAFRAIAERVGFVELEEVRRQREGWQRDGVGLAFGRHGHGGGARRPTPQRGAIRFEADTGQARARAIVGGRAGRPGQRPDG